jgi:hypothetical protein
MDESIVQIVTREFGRGCQIKEPVNQDDGHFICRRLPKIKSALVIV